MSSNAILSTTAILKSDENCSFESENMKNQVLAAVLNFSGIVSNFKNPKKAFFEFA
jgi:hypothetical protein